MRDWVETNDEILDCTSLSLNASAVGLYNISFKVYKKDEPFTAGGPGYSMCFGNQRFTGIVLSQNITPTRQYRNVREWAVTVLARACPENCS